MRSEATLILRNGRVFTVNGKQPWAEAIAVRDDRIIRVGENSEIDELCGENTVVIDAKGRLVLPGFIDGHIHTSTAFQEVFWARLGDAESIEDVAAIVREHRDEHPEDIMVCGSGWVYDAVLSDGRFPKKEDMDRIVSDKPLLVVSYDGWVGLGNSMFTELAVESFKGGPSELGGMERDPGTNEPTGVFHNPGDLIYLAGGLSSKIREKELEGLRWVFRQLPKYGITGVHDAQSDFKTLDEYSRLRDEGGLLVRTYIAYNYDKNTTEEDLRKVADMAENSSDEWVRLGVVKLFIDGVLDSHTAAMLEPYSDDPSTNGKTLYTPDQFNDIVTTLDGMGFQCMTHSCGDRGARIVLDAYEHAADRNAPRERRHRIEHIEMVSDADMPRFRELGVIASMQPIHAVLGLDTTLERAAGPERMSKSFPWRSIDEAGAVLAFSSDWSVADMNPLAGIQAAVARDWGSGASQAVSLEKAIEAYTLNGAYASFEEKVKGSIEEDKLADFIVLSENLFEMDPKRIGEAGVVMTVVGGREIYRSELF
ncbi:MAG: amidohydrolase [Thermoplasmata archaeon]